MEDITTLFNNRNMKMSDLQARIAETALEGDVVNNDLPVCCGKTTVLAVLACYFQQQGKQVTIFVNPGDRFQMERKIAEVKNTNDLKTDSHKKIHIFNGTDRCERISSDVLIADDCSSDVLACVVAFSKIIAISPSPTAKEIMLLESLRR